MSPWTKQPRSHTSLHFWGKEQLFACDKWRNRKYNKDSYLINCLSCSFSGQMVATNMQITVWLSFNLDQLYFNRVSVNCTRNREYQSICLVNFDFHFQSAKGFRLMHNASRPIVVSVTVSHSVSHTWQRSTEGHNKYCWTGLFCPVGPDKTETGGLEYWQVNFVLIRAKSLLACFVTGLSVSRQTSGSERKRHFCAVHLHCK